MEANEVWRLAAGRVGAVLRRILCRGCPLYLFKNSFTHDSIIFVDILSVRYMSGLLCNNEEHVEKRKAAQLISSYHLRDKTSLTFFPCIQCHSNNEPSDTIRNPPKCSPFAMNPLGTYLYVVQ